MSMSPKRSCFSFAPRTLCRKRFAELSRALGSDQAVNYQLVDEPLPPAPAG